MFQERRRAPGRVVAAVAALGVAVGGAIALAPAAGAASVDYKARCTTALFPNIPDMDLKIDLQVAPAKPVYQVGDEVAITWKWDAPPLMPASSPIDLPADTAKPTGVVVLSGAQTGTVPMEGPQQNPPTPKGEPIALAEMTGTLQLTQAGQVDLTPGDLLMSVTMGTLVVPIGCVPVPGTTVPVAASLTVEAPPAPTPTLTGPAAPVQAGTAVALTGTNWPAGTPSVSLCAPDGTACDPAKISASTLQVANGTLSGTATIAPGTAAGNYAFKVTSGEVALTAAVTVEAPPKPPATATAAPTAGTVGSKVTVSGSNFDANEAVDITLVPSGTKVPATAGANGAFSVEVTVPEGLTAIQVARANGTAVATVPFTVVPDGGDPMALTMTQAGTGIDFGTATNGQVQQLSATLNRITVVDARGGYLGWSLSATMTDLVSANGVDKIPAGNLGWTPSCGGTEGNLSEVVTGSPGPLGSTAATLCAQNPAPTTGDPTGGTFTADAAMTLTTPEFGAAGTYTGTLTLTLT